MCFCLTFSGLGPQSLPNCPVASVFWNTSSSSKMWAWSPSWLCGQASRSSNVAPRLSVCSQRFRVAGYALGGTSEPESQLAPFIQQAKDQVRSSSRGDRLCRRMLTLRTRVYLGRSTSSLGTLQPVHQVSYKLKLSSEFAREQWWRYSGPPCFPRASRALHAAFRGDRE